MSAGGCSAGVACVCKLEGKGTGSNLIRHTGVQVVCVRNGMQMRTDVYLRFEKTGK